MNATRHPLETKPPGPNPAHDPRSAWLRCLAPLYPILAIWGVKRLVDAVLFALEKYTDTSRMHTVAFVAAAVLSVAVFCVMLLRGNRPIASRLDPILKIALPLLLLAAAAWWLVRIGAVSDAYVPVLNALLTAIPLVTAGLFIGKSLAYLGLWLFLASTVMSALYLGYTAVVLNAFSGLALLLASWHLYKLRDSKVFG